MLLALLASASAAAVSAAPAKSACALFPTDIAGDRRQQQQRGEAPLLLERRVSRADAVVKAALARRHRQEGGGEGAFVGEFVVLDVHKGAGAVAAALEDSTDGLKNR